MGASASAYFIAGVKLQERKVKGTVTKYNQDTGKPYIKEVTNSEWVIQGTDIVIQEIFEEGEDWGPLTYEQTPNPIFGVLDCQCSYARNVFIGSKIKNVGDWTAVEVTSLEEVKAALDTAKTELAAIGYTGDVQLHLICLLSY